MGRMWCTLPAWRRPPWAALAFCGRGSSAHTRGRRGTTSHWLLLCAWWRARYDMLTCAAVMLLLVLLALAVVARTYAYEDERVCDSRMGIFLKSIEAAQCSAGQGFAGDGGRTRWSMCVCVRARARAHVCASAGWSCEAAGSAACRRCMTGSQPYSRGLTMPRFLPFPCRLQPSR